MREDCRCHTWCYPRVGMPLLHLSSSCSLSLSLSPLLSLTHTHCLLDSIAVAQGPPTYQQILSIVRPKRCEISLIIIIFWQLFNYRIYVIIQVLQYIVYWRGIHVTVRYSTYCKNPASIIACQNAVLARNLHGVQHHHVAIHIIQTT
jgi:hypothetical protein